MAAQGDQVSALLLIHWILVILSHGRGAETEEASVPEPTCEGQWPRNRKNGPRCWTLEIMGQGWNLVSAFKAHCLSVSQISTNQSSSSGEGAEGGEDDTLLRIHALR